MAIESIPTFGGNDDENTSENTNVVGETVQTLELTEGQIETYTEYEAFVDMGRYVAKLREHDDGDDLEALFEWIVEKKDSLREECKELPGNLPMFRSAFPVEDRMGDNYYVLPTEEAAKVGIDYQDEDHLLFPISDGKKWRPAVSLGRPTYVDDDWQPEHGDEQTVEDGSTEGNDTSGAVSSFDISNLTVADIRATVSNVEDDETLEAMLEAEKSGKARKTAIEALEMRIRALSSAEDESEDESDEPERFEGTETTEGVSEAVAQLNGSDDATEAGSENDETSEAESEDANDEVAAAKVEALNAATEAITELTEAIKNL
ncbi:hypothetical protein [Natronorubrum sulfidifaciens]|uniref:Uncharacterized protein n=1 Tax=Natronorubrum sulfidifaciens JCM 14089 TaxID=1230460 RepID=L9WD88_9EURY|nr:hypothetical protein [Natronorubrum sulfidifaciens]ELY47322.1 hypothetical protein C495_03652 [Natronorubrum sulfidifaciens JCM 14089]